MKVLLINNFFYNRGGDCTYTLSLGRLLESKGHEVFYFCMKHPNNKEYEYSNYFTEYIDYNLMRSNINIQNSIKVHQGDILADFDALHSIFCTLVVWTYYRNTNIRLN